MPSSCSCYYFVVILCCLINLNLLCFFFNWIRKVSHFHSIIFFSFDFIISCFTPLYGYFGNRFHSTSEIQVGLSNMNSSSSSHTEFPHASKTTQSVYCYHNSSHWGSLKWRLRLSLSTKNSKFRGQWFTIKHVLGVKRDFQDFVLRLPQFIIMVKS